MVTKKRAQGETILLMSLPFLPLLLLILFFVVSSQKAVTKYEADLTNRVVVDEEVSLRRIPASPQLKGSQPRHWLFGLREVNYLLLIEPYI